MKKLAAAAALILLLIAGAVIGYVLYKNHESRNIHGSPSVEFVTTEPPRPVQRTPDIVWPTYGLRQRAREGGVLGSACAAFPRAVGVPRAEAAEFPPVVGTGSSTSRTTRA